MSGFLHFNGDDEENAGAHHREAWSWRRGWGVAEDLEAVLYWRHGHVGELPSIRMDGDGFRDCTDEVLMTTTFACYLDTDRRRGEC
jgi:hypothetical protein